MITFFKILEIEIRINEQKVRGWVTLSDGKIIFDLEQNFQGQIRKNRNFPISKRL